LLLARFPVEGVPSIYVDDDALWGEDTVLASTDYRLNALRGRIVYGVDGSTPWPSGVQNIRVTYTGGYVSAGEIPPAGQTAMPEAIRRAYLLQCGFEWRNRTHLGQASISGQGASVNIAPAELLPEVKQALFPFQRV
jgi:hypothetical protein